MQVDQQRVEKGQQLTLELTAWGRLGEAMAYYQGNDVFVFGGIPGEIVIAEVTRVRRKYVAATVVEVLKASPDRMTPPCEYYGSCTGCQWQHIVYSRQLAIKQEKVIDALERIGGFRNPPALPVIASPQQFSYRNHARFTIGAGGSLGFVNRETRRFVRIDRCILMHQGINTLLEELQDRCAETTQLSIRAGQHTGDFLIQPTLHNPDIPVPTGQKRYLDSINGRSFRVASPSFFQVNVEQTAKLVQVVRHALDLKGDEVLLDAYTGVGSFAILFAPYVRKVIAVEESSAAIADARENAAALDNVEFVLGKTEDVLTQLSEKPDVALLDPPRAGCQPQALEGLMKLAPPRVVYVSCDPETLARDLKILCHGPYSLEQAQPLDMFPQTHHVECVVLLRRTDAAPLLTLASASPRRRELLAALEVDFQVIPSNAREDPEPGELPEELARRLSKDKARAVAGQLQRGYVIGADSMVVLNGKVFGKPADVAEARQMLHELSGTHHEVVTGLTVIEVASGRMLTDSFASPVAMREFTDEDIEEYIATGRPMDKAGAYAIQDDNFQPARLLEGCYPNVIGLPLCELVEMLSQLGYELPGGEGMEAPKGCLGECLFRAGRTEWN